MRQRSYNIKDYKKFIRYEEGTVIYSIGLTKLKEIAREANATYKINRLVLINMVILDRYLNEYREAERVELTFDQGKIFPRKYIRYKDAVDLYSIGDRTLRKLAKEAEVVRKVGGIAMINVADFERYLEQYHIIRS